MKTYDLKKFKEYLLSYDIVFTNNFYEAIFILEDGTMIDGGYDRGMRGIDHNCLLSLFKHDCDLLHRAYKIVRLVPETQCYLMAKGQRLTKPQKEIIDRLGYGRENYL